jgi:hypothetical protein
MAYIFRGSEFMIAAHIIRIGLSIVLAILLRRVSSKRIKISLVFIIISLYLASLSYGLIGLLVVFVPALLVLLFMKYSAGRTWHKKAFVGTYILFSVYTVIQAADLYMKVLLSNSTQDIIFKLAVVILGFFILVMNYEIHKASDSQSAGE